MPRRLEDFIASLPQEEQEAIQEETERLVAEELTLRELREALDQSQRAVGEALDVNQGAVSKLERRSDMRISTLRDYIRALGGELDIIVRLPGHKLVRINQF